MMRPIIILNIPLSSTFVTLKKLNCVNLCFSTYSKSGIAKNKKMKKDNFTFD